MIRKYFLIKGVVQGVGFRPFIYKLASGSGLNGFVKNSGVGVEVELQGCIEGLNDFEKALKQELPPLASIDTIESKYIKVNLNDKKFEIIKSDKSGEVSTLISPDIATCIECLEDINNKGRFENYFATNCTNCGPRYSIIRRLPYDRLNTSMSKFQMCEKCKKDYENPLNRRYHAQPIACNNCGAKLNNSLKNTADAIKNGKIVAIKGTGGFHIVCDARDDKTLKRLREFKNRPTKPFAIMCKDVELVRTLAKVDYKENELLSSKERPIVVLNKIKKTLLSELIAPNIDKVGCLLPYTPLHHILFKYIDFPIVATSANLGGEPIIIDGDVLKNKLPFVDMFLDFDRDIINGIDDSVVQVIDGDIQTLRLARGYAPKVIKLPFKTDKKILALGANDKNTISLAFKDSVIISPHIGDLNSLESFDFFKRTLESFYGFYNFVADVIVHDKHPNYETTNWAKQQDLKLLEVGHHLAHIYACKAEYGLETDCIGFSFDGTGFGDDGELWGGEVFIGESRKYFFKPIKLLGGEKAIKEPRRIALSMLFDMYTLDEVKKLDIECVNEFSDDNIELLYQSYLKNLNAPASSSVGRLFDAISSFGGLLQVQSYEGEAGLICESNYKADIVDSFEYNITDGIIDIKYDFFDENIISKFINTLVQIILDISKKENLDVILSGGVFQNKTLLELLICEFKRAGIKYYFQRNTPINDGGISLGQICKFLLND